MTKLCIAADFTLPPEAVTETFCLLGKRGSGKTSTAVVMVEEMVCADLPVAVVDPVGVWHGLRSSADGKSAGLPVIIMGGEHGDVPLEQTAGSVIADFVVDARQPCVLDLSSFRKGEQTRFMTDFAERLYHAKAKRRDPLHLVLDEADAFAPQRPMPGEQRLLGACEDLVRRGRSRGLGVSLITQRPAVLNKNVLTQTECLVVLRLTGPQDQTAVDEWVKMHGSPEQRAEFMASLAALPVGTAWFWSAGWLDVFKRVAVRPRHTYDSSATPKSGGCTKAPRAVAEVDLAALKSRIASTIEKVKAEDPRELRRRVAELEKQVAAKAPDKIVERVEVPMLAPELADRLIRATADMVRVAGEVRFALAHADPVLRGHASIPIVRTPPQPTKANGKPHVPPAASSDGSLSSGERKILTVLAQSPEGRAKSAVGILAGYAPSGGGFNNYVSALRSRGYVEGRGADRLRITDAGLKALGDVEPLPTGRALLEYWRGRVGKTERLILETLAQAHPYPLTKTALANRTGREANGGGFNNALSRLRTLELIAGRGELRASDVLMGAQ